MTFAHVRELLASHGLVGLDAEAAFRSWQRSPHSAGGCRVQAILERAGLP